MQSEIKIQAQAFQHLWNLYPQTRGLCFHVPNGGSRNVIEGMQLKASGVVKGIPDIIFIWKGKAYGFEFKTDDGKLSSDQFKIHQIWAIDGTPVFLVRTPDAFISQIESITGLKAIKKFTN